MAASRARSSSVEELLLHLADTVIKLDLSVHRFASLRQLLGQADLQILVSLVPDPLSELDDSCIADADNLAQFSNGQINYLLRMGKYI